MPPTFSDALAQIERGEAVRRAAHEAERLRQQFGGFGCDLAPFVGQTDAEKRAEAERRVQAWHCAEAALKRELIAAARAGSYEADRLYAASCRGDAGWTDRAREFFAAQAKAAA